MFIKTNIPETTRRLDGISVDFGDQMFDALSVKHRTNQIQAIVSGNRCGHSPDAPRFFSPPEHHKRRPTVLDRAIDKWEEVYRRAKKFFKKLVTSHDNGRQVRSERREAIAAVSQVLLHYLELSSLRVGFYAGLNKFIYLDIEYIAKKANLSFSRAKRAITVLARAGYIKVTRQYKKKEDGTFNGEPSVREIAVQFFIDLGMDVQRLFFAREWKRKKEEKKQAKESLKKLKGVIQTITTFRNKTLPGSGKQYTTLSEQEIMKKKAMMNQAMALHKANPERSWIEYLKELRQPLE